MESRTLLALLLMGVIGAILVGWVVVLIRRRSHEARVRRNHFPAARKNRE